MSTTQQTEPMILGWLDNNQAEQEEMKELLSLLQEKGTLDELGIGTIRDAFSNQLFPGITTIQTRAKYLVILLYLLKETDLEAKKAVEKDRPATPEALIRLLNEKQDKLVDVFEKNGLKERGVIGIRSRNVVQKPAYIYWGALTTFGIVNPNLSLYQLCSLFCQNAKTTNQKRNSFTANNRKKKEEDDDYFEDAPDAFLDYPALYSPITWKINNWRDGLTMKLTYDEAKFISDKILSSPRSQNSALAQLLRYYRDEDVVCDFSDVDQIPEDVLDERMKRIFQLAKAFRRFIFGAYMAYNYLLSNRTDKVLKEVYDNWKQQDFNLVPLPEILSVTRASFPQTLFLNELLSHAKAGEWNRYEHCIQKREKELKGNRRKIGTFNEDNPYTSPFVFPEDVDTLLLDFRAHRAGVILKDILKGLI
ncbi:MAG: hypothetical protein IJQ39_14625 [Thermoguttaceae bacterium]|nr:hypothetical protein [Thermoguttaceae bacterium]